MKLNLMSLKEIVKALGYEMDERICRIQYENDLVFLYEGRLWSLETDVVMDILYNEFHDDIKGACEIVDMLEEKYGWNKYLYWAIRFRDRERKEK